jgi:hypothetical protein
MILGNDRAYNERSLVGTVLLTRTSQPVLINALEDRGSSCVVNYIKEGETDKIPTKDLDLSNPLLLGNVNQSGRVLWAHRKASRQYRAGLSQNNLTIVDKFRTRERLNYSSKPIANSLIGNFPPFEESYEAIKKGFAKQVAISRNVTIAEHPAHENNGDLILFWDNKHVGSLEGSEGFKLKEEYEFLSEAIGDILNENH